MVKHVILWKLKDEYTVTEMESIKAEIEKALVALLGKIEGLLEMKVHTHGLPSSNADLMLDSLFESEAALKGYAVHPDHVAVVDTYVRPFVSSRFCLDYEV